MVVEIDTIVIPRENWKFIDLEKLRYNNCHLWENSKTYLVSYIFAVSEHIFIDFLCISWFNIYKHINQLKKEALL